MIKVFRAFDTKIKVEIAQEKNLYDKAAEKYAEGDPIRMNFLN